MRIDTIHTCEFYINGIKVIITGNTGGYLSLKLVTDTMVYHHPYDERTHVLSCWVLSKLRSKAKLREVFLPLQVLLDDLFMPNYWPMWEV